MHSSWGNTIDAPDAFARMGADVMRWQFCAQPPDRNLLFGFGPGREIKRKLLTLWNSARFLVDYARIVALPARVRGGAEPARPRPLDRWLARADEAARAEATAGYDAYLTVERDPRVRGVRRRRLQLVHPPLAAPLLGRRHGRRCTRSGTRSCRGSASSRRSCRFSPSISGRASCAAPAASRRTRCTSRAGPRPATADAGAARGGRRAAARRRARPSGSRGRPAEASPAVAAPRRRGRAALARVTRRSCARSCASRRSSSATSRRPSCT